MVLQLEKEIRNIAFVNKTVAVQKASLGVGAVFEAVIQQLNAYLSQEIASGNYFCIEPVTILLEFRQKLFQRHRRPPSIGVVTEC